MEFTPRASWQSYVAHLLVRARMRPYAQRPIDPLFVRANMGRPKWARNLMARRTGAIVTPTNQGEPPGEWVSAPNAGHPALTMLYLHGGGFIACSPETHRPLVGSLVSRLSARALVPAYRLAPEHPFPAALEDAIAAYRYLIESCDVNPSHLILAGDSAGGGLALSTALSLREHGLPQPAAILAFSPWTDLAVTGKSLDENSNRCAMFAGITIRRAAGFYLGATDARNPLVSPLYANFQGIAPLLIHAGKDEVLRDDAVRVAESAALAGVTVQFRMWPVVPHCWQFFGGMLPEAQESLSLATSFVIQHTENAVHAGVT